jgi:lysosomal Pro-X carboxypeptidase
MAAPAVLAFFPLVLLTVFSPASTSAHRNRNPSPFPPIVPLHLQALRQQQRRASSSDGKLVTAAADAGTNSTAQPFTTHYFPQELDHFTFTPNASMVFRQKYLVNDTFWRRPSGGSGAGPLFVYTGNEGDIEWFATNTGFMFDIAPKFGALLIFIEVPYQLVVRPPALMDLYIHPLYILVSKILFSILNSFTPIHPLYHHLSTLFTVGLTYHFI